MGLTIVARSTVAILDYRVLVRRGLEAIVADSGRHEVQFVASSAAELFSILQECRQTGEMLPDVVILDIFIPYEDGLAILSRLAQEFPTCAPFVITDSSDPAHMPLAFAHGARAYALRDVSASVITGALEALPNNRHFVGPVMVGHLIRAFVAEQRQPGNVLTEREQDVLRLAAQRLSNREIAKSLSITEHTVKTHLRHASEKLGAKTRHEAVSFAVETGMILEPRLTPLTKQASRKHNSSQVPVDDVPPERATASGS
jgi:DNA-binding NarL/FixJ family response regulator